MKRTIVLLLVMISTSAYAQSEPESLSARYILEKYAAMFSIFLMVFMVASFIVVFTRLILEAWLKNKLIEKGVSEPILTQFMQSNKKNVKLEALKWALIFAGLGTGLLLINVFYPLRIYSLPILSLSLAASFYIYYRLLKNLM